VSGSNQDKCRTLMRTRELEARTGHYQIKWFCVDGVGLLEEQSEEAGC